MDDRRIETHPELMDPDWQKHAEREAWTEVNKSKRRTKSARKKRPALWFSLGLVVLVAAAVTVSQLRGKGANDDAVAAQNAMPDFAKVDLARPYARTPAEPWKDGAAGFTVPAPAAVGKFSAEQVANAYDQVSKAVTLGRLDPKVLVAHDPSAYLALFAPNEAKRVKEIMDRPDKFDASAYVTMLADGYRLLPTGPRLNGRLSAGLGKQGELLVRAEYVIAYAFDTAKPENLTGPGDIVAFARENETYSLVSGDEYYKEDQGLGFGGSEGMTYSMACAQFMAGYLAPSYSEPHVASATNSGRAPETAVYDLNQPMGGEHGCK